MSHFCVLALISEETTDVHEEVKRLLAPYDRNLAVPEYEIECWCIGRAARDHGRRVANASLKPIAMLWEEYRRMPEPKPSWERHVYAWVRQASEAEARHPLFARPSPDCRTCQGSGIRRTTFNPQSKWDWWKIGGWWTGFLSGYDPTRDPENMETCDACGGTGRRSDAEEFGVAWINWSKDCTRCGGKGQRVKWPTRWKAHGGDVMPVEQIPRDQIPFAVVTPDGEWNEQGRMARGGMVTEEKDKVVWDDEVRSLLNRWPGALVVVVDCHV